MHDHQKSTWLANASVIAAMELPKCMDRNMHVCMCGWMDVCLQYHYALIIKSIDYLSGVVENHLQSVVHGSASQL
jgi:hypothetical protein